MKILKVQKSKRPIWETKLSINGLISDEISLNEQSYEMLIELYDSEDSLNPEKTILVAHKHYEDVVSRYGMTSLLQGVKIESLFGILKGQEVSEQDSFKNDAEDIANSIVEKMEHDSFYDEYNPGRLREYIEGKILDLKNKYKIEPK
jgi:hypothetical protein